jgi:hypothetical protein
MGPHRRARRTRRLDADGAARTYAHVVVDESELDYGSALK